MYTIYKDKYGMQYLCDIRGDILAFRQPVNLTYTKEIKEYKHWKMVKHPRYIRDHLGYKPEFVEKCSEFQFEEMIFDEL